MQNKIKRIMTEDDHYKKAAAMYKDLVDEKTLSDCTDHSDDSTYNFDRPGIPKKIASSLR
jgi:hypothetical protein